MSGIVLVSHVALWCLVLVESLFIIALLRALGGIQERLSSLSQQGGQGELVPGSTLPDRAFTDSCGEAMQLSSLWQEKRLVVLMASTGCVPCRDTLRWLGALYSSQGIRDWQACALCDGHPTMVKYLLQDANFPTEVPVAAVERGYLTRTFGITTTPTIVIVDTTGLIQRVAVGPHDEEQLRQLITAKPIRPLPLMAS